MTMRVRVGASTDVGVTREQNEDSYLVADPMFAVADGMGGHQGGEVASRLALEIVEQRHREGPDADLGETVRDANRAVLDKAAGDAGLEGMGTTLTLLRLEDRHARIAHVGDSRAYRLRDGEFELLTEDHTLVNRMVREGKLTKDEARIHPHRSILTRALGVEGGLDVDVTTHDLHPGDRILLCSDGLTTVLTDDRIRAVLTEREDPQEACDDLVAAANAGGGPDNITVVVLDLLRDDGDPAPLAAAPAAAAETEAEAEPEAEPAPEPEAEAPPRRRGRRLLLWLLGILLLLSLVFVGARVYVNAQWFVGIYEGHVAVYQGIPTDVLGYELFSLVEETDLPAEQIASLNPWRELPDGITADSEERARELVSQMRRDLAEEESKPPG